MPKQSWTLKEFHGGMNQVSNPRDLEKNQLVRCTGAMVDRPGMIRVAGDGDATYYTIGGGDVPLLDGVTNQAENFFAFSTDWYPDGTSFTSGIETAIAGHTDWLVWTSGITNDHVVASYSLNGGTTWSVGFDITGSHTSKPVFSFAEGILTIYDESFAVEPVWFGIINQHYFEGITGPTAFGTTFDRDLFVASDKLTGGTRNKTSHIKNTVQLNVDTNSDNNQFYGFGDNGGNDWRNGGFWCAHKRTAYHADTNPNGTWEAGTWKGYYSEVFVGDQESPLFELNIDNPNDPGSQEYDGTLLTTVVNDTVGFAFRWETFNDSSGNDGMRASSIDYRQTGFRVYLRNEKETDYWLIGEVDYRKGVKFAGETEFVPNWGTMSDYDADEIDDMCAPSGSSTTVATFYTFEDQPQFVTYSDINGFSVEDSIEANAQRTVVANRRTYLGYIKQNGITYGDRMMKSLKGKFNTFPEDSFIDVAPNDGDQITHLEAFADRILMFKKKAVYVINISGDYEFIENTFKHVGVLLPSQVAKTPYGVVWICDEGIFFYDGKQLKNISEKVIKEDVGATSGFTLPIASGHPCVGYHAKDEKIIFSRGGGIVDHDENAFIYDIKTGSFTFGVDFLDDTGRSNFVNNPDGELIYMVQGSLVIKKVINTSTTQPFEIWTPEIDFGFPGVRKKVYKVYVSYKTTNSTDSGVAVTYGVDSAASMSGVFNASTSTNYGSSTLDDTSANWAIAELKPTSSINNIYSFQLKFYSASVDVGFEINDISIIYRLKNAK